MAQTSPIELVEWLRRTDTYQWHVDGRVPYPLDMAVLFPGGVIDLPGIRGFTFRGPVIFNDLQIPDGFFLHEASFVEGASFERCRFEGKVDFVRSGFRGPTTFGGAIFRGRARFDGVVFDADATFESCRFYDGADFQRTAVQPSANLRIIDSVVRGAFVFDHVNAFGAVTFAPSRFRGKASFDGTVFQNAAVFRRCRFRSDATFANTRFEHSAPFDKAMFFKCADFSTKPDPAAPFANAQFHLVSFRGAARFDNRAFTGVTVFREADFAVAPEFFNTKLPDETDFEHATFGAITQDNAATAEPAYRALKSKMSGLQHHRAEAMFFAKEMRAKCFNETDPLLKRLYAAYGALSDYGQSISRPFYGLVAVAAISLLLYTALMQGGLMWSCAKTGSCYVSMHRAGALIGLALTGLIPFFADTRLAMASAIQTLTGAMVATGAVQAIEILEMLASLLFLFFLGLGIPNLFRLK